jgi:hypothetical protein
MYYELMIDNNDEVSEKNPNSEGDRKRQSSCCSGIQQESQRQIVSSWRFGLDERSTTWGEEQQV